MKVVISKKLSVKQLKYENYLFETLCDQINEHFPENKNFTFTIKGKQDYVYIFVLENQKTIYFKLDCYPEFILVSFFIKKNENYYEMFKFSKLGFKRFVDSGDFVKLLKDLENIMNLKKDFILNIKTKYGV